MTYRVIGNLQTPGAVGLTAGEVFIEQGSGAWRVYQWIGYADMLCDHEGFPTLEKAERWAKIWMWGAS